MSIIVTRIEDGTVTMGADSCVTYGDGFRQSDLGCKLFHAHGVTMGVAGRSELATLARLFLSYYEQPLSEAEFDIITWFDQFGKFLKDKDYNDREDDYSAAAEYHIALNGHAFEVVGHYVRPLVSFAALGSGHPYATSALYLGHDVPTALSVACQYDNGCAFPLEVIKETPEGFVRQVYEDGTKEPISSVGIANRVHGVAR